MKMSRSGALLFQKESSRGAVAAPLAGLRLKDLLK